MPPYTAGTVKGWRMAEKLIWNTFTFFASLAVLLILSAPQRAAAAPADDEIVIVAFGDSLTAGYQLPPAAAFPVQLEKALRAKGLNVRVVNSGVSGDTSADALARFDWAMPEKADAAIVELGANDALRGIPLAETEKAMGEIVARLKARKMEVLIAGMEAPRNWGEEYTQKFRQMYRTLTEDPDVLFYPFFLEGVALDQNLNLGDGLHPNEEGVKRIVAAILPQVEALIERAKKRRDQPS
jgi:acyl-CoA thioesterase I